jgi:predicted RNA-binding protein with TRAM domain
MAEDEKVLSTADEDLTLQVGDLVRVVVQDFGDQDDPIAYVDGTVTIIKEGDGVDLGFGDSVSVRISDIGDNKIYAVATGGFDD